MPVKGKMFYREVKAVLEDEFGDIIRKCRYAFKLEPEDVARQTALSTATIERFERYEQRPLKDESDRLASLFRLDPVGLWSVAQKRYAPEVSLPQEVDIHRFVFTSMEANGYVIHFKQFATTWAVDPGGPAELMIDCLKKKRWTLDGILLTHGHADHVGGVDGLHAETKAPVYSHADEWRGKGWVDVAKKATIRHGNFVIDVLPSPGHTPHGVVYTLPHHIAVVGDTLFAGSLGRCYDEEGAYTQLLQSARNVLSLPEHTIVLPGHGPMTTVGQERRFNPFFLQE